ncbi:MAG: zf-TFIIB domain-containing protein [Candidatus Omnitrophica bacterium]|nr:zf-TFIIB domain-containing protein [Candidatus Omnitrophota bacterium]MDD5487678.1 zf-TFIIB domain-containing protein [Candidatus Omnitrophota bacterium]
MNCPVCSGKMVEKNFGVKVDVCENCKGIWFDNMELKMLDEHSEGLGGALEEALKMPRTNDENRGQIPCPKCQMPMHIHKYKRSQEVNVDECYSCGGFFLDPGELKEIRDSYMSDRDIDAYVEKMLNDIPEYRAAKELIAAAEKDRGQAIRKLAGAFRATIWNR